MCSGEYGWHPLFINIYCNIQFEGTLTNIFGPIRNQHQKIFLGPVSGFQPLTEVQGCQVSVKGPKSKAHCFLFMANQKSYQPNYNMLVIFPKSVEAG